MSKEHLWLDGGAAEDTEEDPGAKDEGHDFGPGSSVDLRKVDERKGIDCIVSS